ncbi:MAG TPA: toprim domain-containing protein, partial [Opitutales bacterium]|nr:toprim domain-containing protein [Opitutales bacterium]
QGGGADATKINEALEALAGRYNITLEYADGGGPGREERSARRELLDVHEAAADFYHRAFMAGDDMAGKVRAYWTDERRFSMEVAKDFRIGFDPPTGDGLLKFLLGRGHSPKILMESGIFTAPDGPADPRKMRSRFRGRLIVPIREATQGQVIAFTARKLFCTPGADTMELGKYVNSPGTALFHKSHVLFNLDRAQKAVRTDKAGFMMVEGQLDTIRCFTNGFESTVAGQGTSITDEQLHILRRHSERIRVVLDGDAAGQKAALRLMPMAFAAGLEPSFVVLPQGRDPDSLIAGEGPDAMKALVASALSPMQFLSRILRNSPDYSGAHGLAEAMKKASEILASVESEVARGEYLRELSLIMGFDHRSAMADMARFSLRGSHAPARSESVGTAPSGEKNAFGRLKSAESEIWYFLLRHEELALPFATAADDHWIDAATMEGRLLGRLFWELKEGGVSSVSEFISAVKDDDERNYLYSLGTESRDVDYENPSQDADNLLGRLFITFRKRRIVEIDTRMASLPAGSDLLEPLLREKVSLSKTFKQLPCLKVKVG